MNDDPPDEWSESEPDRTKDQISLDDASEMLRTVWIAAVREYHLRRHGNRSNYCSSKLWDGGFDKKTGRNYKPKWPGFVQRARVAGVDPLGLVEVLFESLNSDTVPPPYALVADTNIDRLRRKAPVVSARVANAVRKEETVFGTALWAAGLIIADPKAQVRYVLNDQGRQLSPLFRYAMAVIAGHKDIAENWRLLAEIQFSAAPEAYLTHWRHVLPEHMVNRQRSSV